MPKEFYFEYVNNCYDWQPNCVSEASRIKTQYKLDFLSNFNAIKETESLIEISSFDGDFLSEFTKHNPKVEYATGIEPSSKIYEFCKSYYQDKRLNFINCLSEQYKAVSGRSYDFICSSMAFAQCAYPIETLQTYSRIIKPGGYLYIDEGTFLENMLNFEKEEIYWYIFQGQKNYFYSINTIQYIFGTFGFNLIAKNSVHIKTRPSWTNRYTGILFQKREDYHEKIKLDFSRNIFNLLNTYKFNNIDKFTLSNLKD